MYVKDLSYYGKSGLWNEIEYSIKSVRKFYPDAVCWVVGDDPGFGVNHIEAERFRNNDISHQATFDVINKMYKIIESEVGSDFVLMYDDVYFLQKVDYTIWYAYNKVNNLETYQRKWSRSYMSMWRQTYRLIDAFREDLWDWETHLPRYLNKEKLNIILHIYGHKLLIPTSLYAGHYIKETVLMTDEQYDLVKWPPDIPVEEGFKRKFLNLMDSAITLEFEEKMADYYN